MSGETPPGRHGWRHYLSYTLLGAAQRQASEAYEIEVRRPDGLDPDATRHAELVTTSLIASAALLDAFINELFSDAADAGPTMFDLDEQSYTRLRDWWRLQNPDRSPDTMTKYDMLRVLTNAPPLDRGSEPAQSANLLIKLRNSLVHYKPETVWEGDDHRLMARYRGKFETSTMPGTLSRTWPLFLGADAARWGWRTAESLVRQEAARAGYRSSWLRPRDD